MTIKTDTTAEQPAAIAFDLKHPFTNAAGVRIERLSLRRAKRADYRAAHQYSKDEFGVETFLFARLSGLTMEDIDALDMEDSNEMVQRFRGMFDKSAVQP